MNKSLEKFNHFLNFLAYKYNLNFDTISKDLQDFCKDEKDNLFLTTLEDDYKNFIDINEERLEAQFGKEHGFQTSVRGLKVRGSYPSQEEAELRCKMLREVDPNHDVYVGPVGMWMPFHPESYKTGRVEYLEDELNQIMQEKNKNEASAKVEFEKRVRSTKEKAMEDNPGGLFLLSSWHYPQLAKKAAWQPMLIGQLREKNTQRHVLCAKQDIANFAALKGAKVASAGNKAFTLNVLADLLGAEHRALVTEQNVLAVPKDIDALMAIGFGVAQAAVATEGGLARLAKTNAKQHDALKQLATGPERLLSIVVAPAVPDAASQSLIKVLAGMGADAEGQQRLRLLGLDGLVPIADAQRTELRK